MITVNFIAFSKVRGGAAKAASRFYLIIRNCFDTNFFVAEDGKVSLYNIFFFLKRVLSYLFCFYCIKNTGTKCSVNFFSHRSFKKALALNEGLVNIHWINNDTISIFDLKKTPYASIITLHDEWLYCGIEHYFDINSEFNNSVYSCDISNKKNKHISYLHKFVWGHKIKAFKGRGDLVITCPSKWLADRAKKSLVLKDCDVRILYNPVDVTIFKKNNDGILKKSSEIIEKDFFTRKLIVFGAVGGSKNKLKGYEELSLALHILSKKPAFTDKVLIGLFGAKEKGLSSLHGFPVVEFGYIKSEQEMATIYSKAYATIVPSKVEAFGQVAAESQACETPVIAFDTSGLKDVVIDGKTGFLAKPFSSQSLADKIEQLINLDNDDYVRLSRNARQHVIDNFSFDVVAESYKKIIEEQWKKKQEANK